ncbi:MAG: hypothetical protein RLZZ628_2827 [Bacteroidota bacterium]|jgi:hypothetical protein
MINMNYLKLNNIMILQSATNLMRFFLMSQIFYVFFSLTRIKNLKNYYFINFDIEISQL